MGTWGPGSFENDTAADWADGLQRCADATLITEALSAVNECPEFLEADEAACALAAAEVVAALCGRPAAQLPEQLAIWAHEHAAVFTPELLQLAATALNRITTDSELKTLWEDGGADEWFKVVADLERRLGVVQDNTAAPLHLSEPEPAPPRLRLTRREVAGDPPPVLDPSSLTPEMVAALRAEYHRLKAARVVWQVLSLVLGGGGIAIILFIVPGKDDRRPFGEKESYLAILALVMFGLGLLFAGKAKGRGLFWGFTALGRISLFRRAAEKDLLAARLEELKRTLEAHGEKI
jgi:hypothetical protein